MKYGCQFNANMSHTKFMARFKGSFSKLKSLFLIDNSNHYNNLSNNIFIIFSSALGGMTLTESHVSFVIEESYNINWNARAL